MGMLEDLLSKGYFPKELPPGFTTAIFGALLTSTTPPLSFTNPKRKSANVCHYSLARSGSFRRRLGIPNPVPHYNLCKAIADNFSAIDGIITGASLTVSRPVSDPKKVRAVVPEHREGKLLELRAQRRASATYLLRADIADFYPSIYTHILPWAVHGKSLAKQKRRDLSLYGNLLDHWVRKGQDDQTLGIPIGPDTSHVLAELVLADAERVLRVAWPTLVGTKFYDDYEITFTSHADAERCLTSLENALVSLELRLNTVKSKVAPLPQTLDERWSSPIRGFHFRGKVGQQRTDLTAYFNMLFEAIAGKCSEAVVGYALSRLEGDDIKTVHPENSEYVQHLISQCMVTHPASVRFGIRQLLRLREAGHTVSNAVLADTLTQIVLTHAPLGHSSEVAWSLWAAMGFSVVLNAACVSAISAMQDAAVAILALDAARVGAAPGVNAAAWNSAYDASELHDRQWLLAYEANVQGWLPPGTVDYVGSDPDFVFLKSNSVKFYTPFTSASSKAITGPELKDYE